MSTQRVLVVEDVPELSQLLEVTFDFDERFTAVGVAADATRALELASAEQPDAVVLDISIDGESNDLLPRLVDLLPRARIVIFTGHDDPVRRETLLAAGASAYVVKGGDLDVLLETLADGASSPPPRP